MKQRKFILSQIRSDRIFTVFLLLAGIILPFLLVTYCNYYYVNDVATFRGWAECLAKYSEKIYLACLPVPPNYPVVGLFLSAGTIHAIKLIFDISDSQRIDLIFRYYLAFFDSLNFLLLSYLATLMQFRFPVSIGLLLLIVPSTLAGGAIWGQIDGIFLCFCLLAAIGFFKSWRSSDVESDNIGWKSGLWFLFGTLNLSIFILIKQLAVFSLPFFFLLSLIAGCKLWKFHDRGWSWLVIACGLFGLSFHYLDSKLAVPEQFKNSSLWFVWMGEGSKHAEKISGNGFNIWIFLGRAMNSSSREPFSFLWKHSLGNFDVIPYYAGIFLYAIFMVFLVITGSRMCWLFVQRVSTSQHDRAAAYSIACLCFFLGLSQLGFNVLLTGTHERYLYLGYPFLLIAIAWFFANKIKFSWRSTLFCFFTASAYGFFVLLWTKTPLPGILFPVQRPEFLASIHLFLLVVLLEKWMQIWRWSELK